MHREIRTRADNHGQCPAGWLFALQPFGVKGLRQLTVKPIRQCAPGLLVLIALAVVCPTDTRAQKLRDILSESTTLTYRDYMVRISVSRDGKTSTATVKRTGRVIAKYVNASGPFSEIFVHTRIGLVSLLGKRTNQLIIQQYSGGAHCCLSWRIYDLYPKFRLIFDSDQYPIGDAMEDAELIDLDRDGQLEFAHQSNQFAYFDDACFTCLLLPDVVFRFDRRTQRYLPANHIFKKYALRQVPFDLERLRSSEDNPSKYWAYTLDVVLRYIYAGMEKRAWAFFAKTYGGRSNQELKNKIRLNLRTDGIYRFLYGRGHKRSRPEPKESQR